MIEKYEVTKDITLIRDDNVKTTYPEDTVIFNIQAFKMSGKYYTSIRLILEGITVKDIQDWKEHPTEDKNSYTMFNSIIDFIKHQRPFFRDMDLVINCDSFYPVMIHGIKELDIPKVLKPTDVEENDATFKQTVKRGNWICEFYNDVFDVYQADCSVCKKESTNKYDKVSEEYEYCPHCGAKMIGGEVTRMTRYDIARM